MSQLSPRGDPGLKRHWRSQQPPFGFSHVYVFPFLPHQDQKMYPYYSQMEGNIKCNSLLFYFHLYQLWMDTNLQRPEEGNSSLMLRFCYPCGDSNRCRRLTEARSIAARPAMVPLRTHSSGGLHQRRAPAVSLCDVPSQDAPLVPLQEMKESWHRVDVTLSRINP